MTRKEALRKHREMWTAMQKKLGDNPKYGDRVNFKTDWTHSHGENILCDCYLCEYAENAAPQPDQFCSYCPIVWGGNEKYDCAHIGEGNNLKTYGDIPISVILSFPERKK